MRTAMRSGSDPQRRQRSWRQASLLLVAVLCTLPSSSLVVAEPSGDRTFDGVACVRDVETFLKVRAGAASDADIVGRLRADACGFTVVHACRADEWCRVYLPGEFNGWAHGRYLRAWDPNGLDRRAGAREAPVPFDDRSVAPGTYAYRATDFAAELIVTGRVSVLSLVGRDPVEDCPRTLATRGICDALRREGEMVLRLAGADDLGAPERPGGPALTLTNLAISVEPEGADATIVLHDTWSGTTENIALGRE